MRTDSDKRATRAHVRLHIYALTLKEVLAMNGSWCHCSTNKLVTTTLV